MAEIPPPTSRSPWLIFILLALTSALAVVVSVIIIYMSSIGIYDTNFEIFHGAGDAPPKLTTDEAQGIFLAARSMCWGVAVPLMLANGAWIVAAGVFLWRRK